MARRPLEEGTKSVLLHAKFPLSEARRLDALAKATNIGLSALLRLAASCLPGTPPYVGNRPKEVSDVP